MRSLIIIAILLLALLLAYFCIRQHTQEIPLDIQNRSYDALTTEGLDAIGVTTDGRDITLSGIVEKAKTKERAEGIAKRVYGVRTVTNNIMVVPKAMPEPEEVVIVPELTVEEVNKQCEADMAQAIEAQAVEFAFGSSEISDSSLPLLQQIAETARNCPDSWLKIEGHTDNIGKKDTNMLISQQRAQAVAGYLRDVAELKQTITAEGFGPNRPKASNDTDEGRQKNRRIEIKVNMLEEPASLEDE